MKFISYIYPTAAVVFLTAAFCSAFSTPVQRWGLSRSHLADTTLKSAKNDRFSEGDRARKLFLARTCLKHFLTQRALQSFLFLLGEVHDPHTVDWIEEFANAKNLHEYHGTGALNFSRFESWDSFLMDLMEEPEDEIVVLSVRRSRSGSNWQKMNLLRQQGKLDEQENKNKTETNPYLKDETVEYVIDIDPPSLVSRMISVREQLSKEWVEDLDVVFEHHEMILEQYEDFVNEGRNEEKDSATEDIAKKVMNNLTNSVSIKLVNATIDSEGNDDDQKKDEGEEEVFNLAEEGRSDLGDYSAEYSTSPKQKLFKRVELHMLTNYQSYQGMASSPLRKGTFDLLILLATQESIHRVLQELKREGKDKEVSHDFLRDFYTGRLEDYFDGDQRYGRADDFLEEMLLTSPSVMYTKDGGMGLIDPHGIAEKIIFTRGEVISDWKKIVSKTPEDHMNLRKALLDRQMEKLMPTFSDADGTAEHIEHVDVFEGGAFE